MLSGFAANAGCKWPDVYVGMTQKIIYRFWRAWPRSLSSMKVFLLRAKMSLIYPFLSLCLFQIKKRIGCFSFMWNLCSCYLSISVGWEVIRQTASWWTLSHIPPINVDRADHHSSDFHIIQHQYKEVRRTSSLLLRLTSHCIKRKLIWMR